MCSWGKCEAEGIYKFMCGDEVMETYCEVHVKELEDCLKVVEIIEGVEID